MNEQQRAAALRLADAIDAGHGYGTMIDIATELRRLHGEVESLRADAERYRWLRDKSAYTFTNSPEVFRFSFSGPGIPDAVGIDDDKLFDAAVDAAMKEGA